MALASQLCTAVFEGDLPLLRRLLQAGASADTCDYDKRTALHIAAAEGNLPAVQSPTSFSLSSLVSWSKPSVDQ